MWKTTEVGTGMAVLGLPATGICAFSKESLMPTFTCAAIPGNFAWKSGKQVRTFCHKNASVATSSCLLQLKHSSLDVLQQKATFSTQLCISNTLGFLLARNGSACADLQPSPGVTDPDKFPTNSTIKYHEKMWKTSRQWHPQANGS